MNFKKKILICITARPSYSRIKSTALALNKRDEIDLVVLASGSALLERYGRVVDQIKDDGLTVVEELYTFVEGNDPINMALTTASTLSASAMSMARIAPDLVVTIADRYETLGTAIAASYSGIPLIHIQGGEITGNIDERVRHAVTKLSDMHLVANHVAGDRIRSMGEDPSTIFVTGCPSIDIAVQSRSLDFEIVKDSVTQLGVGQNIDLDKPYCVILQHPETEQHTDSYNCMMQTLCAVKEASLASLIFWPNVDAGSDATSKALRVSREQGVLKTSRLIKNLEGEIFLRLLSKAECLIGNSSVGIRECSFLGVPVVNIGCRQDGRTRGHNVLDSQWNQEEITAAILKQIYHGKYESDTIYGDGKSGETIAKLLASELNFGPKRFVDP